MSLPGPGPQSTKNSTFMEVIFCMYTATTFREPFPICLGQTWKTALLTLAVSTFALGGAASAAAQAGEGARTALLAHPTRSGVIVPESSKAKSGDLGLRAHANVRYSLPAVASPSELPPYAGYGYETPASLACIYRLAPHMPGCNPNETTVDSHRGSQTIAIVDAYDDPMAVADLQAFSSQFGLPFSTSKFKVVYATGSVPPTDSTGGWELEESLDIEYAHAMAPNAKLYLVEAKSNSFNDLFAAVTVANNLIACGKSTTCPAKSDGHGEVSMSWGGQEFQGEDSIDSFFNTPGIVYFAASGDSPGVIFPCVLSTVVCVGGTSTSRNPNTGDLNGEISWTEGGGGISEYEPIPAYQKKVHSVAAQLGGYRGVPDVSAVSNPDTGLWVLDTYPLNNQTGWFIVGGTSAATPLLAGITNANTRFAPNTVDELQSLYGPHKGKFYHDVFYGACGPYSGYFSAEGWDFCTGLGTPNDWQD